MLKIVSLILFSCFSLDAKAVCITNFNKNICANFQILPRVIIKTKLTKNQLRKELSLPIQLLATLHDSNLFMVRHNKSLDYAKKLEKKVFIIYAQPDIFQKKQNSSNKYDKQQDLSTRYHLSDIWNKTKGEGIKIAIIDDGFNLDHEDLKGVDIAFEYDVE